MNQSQRIMEALGEANTDQVVQMKQGDGFWYAVLKYDPSKTVMRGKTEDDLRNKLVKARRYIIDREEM